MVDNADALNSMARQCDDDILRIDKATNEAERAIPIPECKAHWASVKLNTAVACGVKTLLTCRAEEYRDRIRQTGADNQRHGERNGDRPGGQNRRALKILGFQIPAAIMWILALIVVALGCSGVLKPVVLFFFGGGKS